MMQMDNAPSPQPTQQPASTTAIIQLTPMQSCNLHGWTNPKRTLSWEDIKTSGSITLGKCLQQGISPDDLRSMQPDIKMWIKHKRVSFGEVVPMKAWPLHPVMDLKGNISDLASMHYPPHVLYHLGITYAYLREVLRMDDEWMRMLRYTPAEWATMGFTHKDAEGMGAKRLRDVFRMEPDCVLLAMSAAPPRWSMQT